MSRYNKPLSKPKKEKDSSTEKYKYGRDESKNNIRDLQKQKKEKALKESAVAQLRKRSKDSIARPKAEKNILSNDPRMQRI